MLQRRQHWQWQRWRRWRQHRQWWLGDDDSDIHCVSCHWQRWPWQRRQWRRWWLCSSRFHCNSADGVGYADLNGDGYLHRTLTVTTPIETATELATSVRMATAMAIVLAMVKSTWMAPSWEQNFFSVSLVLPPPSPMATTTTHADCQSHPVVTDNAYS